MLVALVLAACRGAPAAATPAAAPEPATAPAPEEDPEIAALNLDFETLEDGVPAGWMVRGDGYEGEGWVLLRHPETAVVERALFRLVEILRVEAGG